MNLDSEPLVTEQATKQVTEQAEVQSGQAASAREYGSLQHPWLLGAALLVVMALVFALGMTFGYGWGRSVASAAVPSSDGGREGAASVAHTALDPAFDLFWEAMELLYRDFNGTLPDPGPRVIGVQAQ